MHSLLLLFLTPWDPRARQEIMDSSFFCCCLGKGEIGGKERRGKLHWPSDDRCRRKFKPFLQFEYKSNTYDSIRVNIKHQFILIILVCYYFSSRAVIKCNETTIVSIVLLVLNCSYNIVNTINTFTTYMVTRCGTISAHLLSDSQPLEKPHIIFLLPLTWSVLARVSPFDPTLPVRESCRH